MLKKFIKKDKNKELEKILEQQNIDEQARSLLQGILYKIEVSHKDYKKVKAKQETEEKYVQDLLDIIKTKCEQIKIVKPSQKLADKKIQAELEKNKYYVGKNEIVSYPIEEKILTAIEEISNNEKILNNKYEEATIGISHLINTGKNLDRIEVLRDFSGWSWTTKNSEIENIEANLIYQILQIILGEEFLENWHKNDNDAVDYLELLTKEIAQKSNAETAEKLKELLIRISVANIFKYDTKYANNITKKIKKLNTEIDSYSDTKQKLEEISNYKKQLLKELSNIDIQLKTKQKLLKEIEKANKIMIPANYLKEKDKLIKQKEKLEIGVITQEETEKMLIEFIKIFLKCFNKIIEQTEQHEEIVKLIYKLRYFMLLPFNTQQNIKDLEELQEQILETEKQLVEKAKAKKVIVNIPFEIMTHVFKTRIIILEELYYKITKKDEKHYVQIFDENISEEKFEITLAEKTKINKKIRIFI